MKGQRQLPKKPFRDSAILYGVLAGIVLVVGLFLGRSVVWSVVVALVAFVLATGYAWWRFQRRIDEERTNP
ncbi:MAG: hypothetical protein E6G45_07745 [Actinobacteria bacterium]|nr:MAG: hypothetical protein E6G45_07745 [Actinomycetota bacterium]